MSKPAFSQYGIIGNKYTIALISSQGSIDWCSVPFLQSATIFSALIQKSRGGYFSIKPEGQFTSYQHYIRGTNVVETAFRSDSGTVVLTDFMPVNIRNEEIINPEIIRVLRCCEGEVKMQVDYYPRFNYGKGWNKVSEIAGGILARNYDETGILATDLSFSIREGHARSSFTIESGKEVSFCFCYGIFSPAKLLSLTVEKLDRTIRYWRAWVAVHADDVKTRDDMADRSILLLKLLSHPCTSLVPESAALVLTQCGNNEQYRDGRLCLISGMSISLVSFFKAGYNFEAELLMKKAEDLFNAYADKNYVQSVFLANGNDRISPVQLKSEDTIILLKSTDEYNNTSPFSSICLLVWAAGEYLKFRKRIPNDTLWKNLNSIAGRISAVWDKPDADFWQQHTEKQQYVISKVLCWTALDCLVQLAKRHTLSADIDQWEKLLNTMRQDILDKGYDGQKKTFIQAYGSDVVDATALLMLRFGFLEPDDERMCNTIEYIQKHLLTKEYLVKNSTVSKNAFTRCSFWMADCMQRMGRHEDAASLIAAIIEKCEPLYLMPEMINVDDESFEGCYPHAYTHADFIISSK